LLHQGLLAVAIVELYDTKVKALKINELWLTDIETTRCM
jgi:hypothetical protein